MDAGFRVETAATSFQVDQDTLARVGGVVRHIVAEDKEDIDSFALRKAPT